MKNCFNALLFVLVIGITLTISRCSSDAPEGSPSDEPQRFKSVIVDIQTGGDGYYSLMSDVEVPGEETANEWLEAVSSEEYEKLD